MISSSCLSSHHTPRMALPPQTQPPAKAMGFKRNTVIFAHDIQQWIITARQPTKLFSLGQSIILHDTHSPESAPQAGTLSHIKALEIEWVSFYVSVANLVSFEVSIPVYWVQLPAYRQLEYALLSHTMPVILARAFPAHEYYEKERSQYLQRRQTRHLRNSIPDIISTPQSFCIPLRSTGHQTHHHMSRFTQSHHACAS